MLCQLENMLRSKTSPPVTPSLPTELLEEIIIGTSLRHQHGGYIIEARSLSALSRVSRRLRAIVLPMMYREVVLTSEKQLRAFQHVPFVLMGFVRELNIFMDVQFLEAWGLAAFANPNTHPSHPSIYEVLLDVLSHMSRLATLRMRVAEIEGVRSGWGKFAMSQRTSGGSYGIPIGRAIREALCHVRVPQLTSLRKLELDGFQDIEPLVKLAPDLESLSMCISGGFSAYVNAELVWAVKCVPKLRRLQYTPSSLNLEEGVLKTGDGSDPSETAANRSPSTLGLLDALGRLVPNLQELDLQTRNFDEDSIEFRTRIHLIPSEELPRSLSQLSQLQTLRLPSTVLSAEESQAARSTYVTFLARQSARVSSAQIEAGVIASLTESHPALQSVSFVRPTDPKDWVHYSVTFPVRRDSKVNVEPVTSTAADGQYAPWPFAPSLPLRFVLSKWWLAAPGSGSGLAVSYIRDRCIEKGKWFVTPRRLASP